MALSVAAATMFKVFKTGFSIRTKQILFIWLAIVVLAFGYPIVKEFFLVDACLDSGGRWIESLFICQR